MNETPAYTKRETCPTATSVSGALSDSKFYSTSIAPHTKTRRVMVGTVPIGGGAPCAVQSMLNLPLSDVEGNVAQIARLAEAGCEIIRIAIPHKTDLDYF